MIGDVTEVILSAAALILLVAMIAAVLNVAAQESVRLALEVLEVLSE